MNIHTDLPRNPALPPPPLSRDHTHSDLPGKHTDFVIIHTDPHLGTEICKRAETQNVKQEDQRYCEWGNVGLGSLSITEYAVHYTIQMDLPLSSLSLSY